MHRVVNDSMTLIPTFLKPLESIKYATLLGQLVVKNFLGSSATLSLIHHVDIYATIPTRCRFVQDAIFINVIHKAIYVLF